MGDAGIMSTYPQFELSEGEDLMPSQWADIHGQRARTAERRLHWAVLADALRCWQRPLNGKGGQRAVHRHYEAEDWLLETGTGVFSFDGVCEMLELNADWMRAGLRAWQQRFATGGGELLARRAPVVGENGTLHVQRKRKRKDR